MYLLHAINSDRQTRLLNVLGQTAMILGDKKKFRSLIYSLNYMLKRLRALLIIYYSLVQS